MKELPESEWPREKLEKSGPGSLTNTDLIAILLRTGIQGTDVLALSAQLLRDYTSLAALARCSVTELAKIKGIGPAKAVQLAAAFELGNRLAREQLAGQPFDNPQIIYQFLAGEMRALPHESLRVVLLNTRNHLIRVEEISRGSVNETVAHPLSIFRPAIIHNATGIILVHNHPSGDPAPSRADITMTRKIAEAATLLQVRLVDHLILGAPSASSPGYFSFRENGVL